MGHYFAIGIKWLRFFCVYFNFIFKYFFLTGAIDHAPHIFLRAFSGAGAIAPVS
jgi:hypothetical protein